MVEQIEEFRAELDAESLVDLGPLEDSEVKVVDAGSAEDRINTSFGSEPPLRRRCKAGGVEPAGEVATAGFQVATGNHVGTNIGYAQTGGLQRSGGTCPIDF
jgi:hypothetical protein